MLVLIEARLVEDVELTLRAPVRDVGDPGTLEVIFRLLRDVAGVARVGLARDRVLHEAVDHQGRMLAEGIHDRGLGVGHQKHVRLLDLLEPADRGPVESVAFGESLLGQLIDRYREMLREPRQVCEAEVDDLNFVVLREFQYVLGRFGHVSPSFDFPQVVVSLEQRASA